MTLDQQRALLEFTRSVVAALRKLMRELREDEQAPEA